jgi:transcription-repair coupling factor (superfamily II helicase)
VKLQDLSGLYLKDDRIQQIVDKLEAQERSRIHLTGLKGSSSSMVVSTVNRIMDGIHVVVLQDKELAAYVYNDLENLQEEKGKEIKYKKVLFFPTSYKRPYEVENMDNANVLSRTEVLNRAGSNPKQLTIVTYGEALCEKVVTKSYIKKNTIKAAVGESVSLDFFTDLLMEYGFEMVDFVYEPGQFSIRGGIVDAFSFASEYPYRIEFFGDEIESIRSFDPVTQLSVKTLKKITILPNVQNRDIDEKHQNLLEFLPGESTLWIDDIDFARAQIEKDYEKAEEAYANLEGELNHLPPDRLFTTPQEFNQLITNVPVIELGTSSALNTSEKIHFNIEPQPSFNKNFEILVEQLDKNEQTDTNNVICSEHEKQLERINTILEDMQAAPNREAAISYDMLRLGIHEGFVDADMKVAVYTDHQIFERYHKFHLRDSFKAREAITLKEIYGLQPGDYVVHIDHGIGRFDGLEKIDNNGKMQEAIRLFYANNDILYVSIHSLHRISKYTGKEGAVPKLHKLGGATWAKTKAKTKSKVKDIAKELIQLYAKRKASKGFAFTEDTYLQHELEASFIYEDTPDQLKATQATKADMEKDAPMDRLVCGDVGFGKTEIAIRAAFKAVADSKQVAVLVPTTILALQHSKTFANRLKELPCRVDYLNRFKTAKQQKQTLKDLKDGKIDILIGTHRLISKDVEFKDLGLLVIDEEQKFGVAVKEKLKQFKANVDTLTLTATPIPRTLQFSLMGARDLSVINTAPPNRYPVQTELHSFSPEVIRDAVSYEINRGGQVFFLHNRVQNIMDVAGMIQKFVPDARIAIGHGQMEGPKLESVMLDFIEHRYDVLVATTIIESGLDIPNANTIIINDAQNYGLSELHQLRGRVGRSNKKAFAILLSPPLSTLTSDARKRLKSIEEFSNLGSGFNIAMRDLDIRGAGNILGGEQSGFISDIGFEMYHKILDEAVQELKETEFKDLYEEEEKEYVTDCIIETDLEILFTDDYILNITERISLYKELDSIANEEQLQAFMKKLNDRFGPPPKQAMDLIDTIRLRWVAKSLGFEKLVLKSSRLVGFFVSNQDSTYYQSPLFVKILGFVQAHPSRCQMKEGKEKLSIVFPKITDVSQALRLLESMNPMEEEV